MILYGLNEASHPCEKTLPERLIWVQACTRGSRSSQALGKGCFGPEGPGPKEDKDVETSWHLCALQPVTTFLSFCCPRLGDQRHTVCSGPEKITCARKPDETFHLAGLHMVPLQNSALLSQLLMLTDNTDVTITRDTSFSIC